MARRISRRRSQPTPARPAQTAFWRHRDRQRAALETAGEALVKRHGRPMLLVPHLSTPDAIFTEERYALSALVPTEGAAGECVRRPAVPAGTPAPIIDRLNAETRKILSDQKYVALIHSMGTDVAASSPREFGDFVRDDVARWTKVIDNAGIPKIE